MKELYLHDLSVLRQKPGNIPVALAVDISARASKIRQFCEEHEVCNVCFQNKPYLRASICKECMDAYATNTTTGFVSVQQILATFFTHPAKDELAEFKSSVHARVTLLMRFAKQQGICTECFAHMLVAGFCPDCSPPAPTFETPPTQAIQPSG